MARDPYTVLGVPRNASRDDIKRAFHKLAHKHHPDKGGDAEKFKEVSAAYAQLKDGPAGGSSNDSPYDNPPKREYEFWDEASNDSGNFNFWSRRASKEQFDFDAAYRAFTEHAARQYQEARERQAKREANPQWKILRKQIELKQAVIGVLEREIEALEAEIDRL